MVSHGKYYVRMSLPHYCSLVAPISRIHSQIYKTVGRPIIQVETEEVYFDEINQITEKKGVLSKEKDVLEIKVRVVLLVKYLNINEGGKV